MKMAVALAFAGTLTVTAQTAAPAKSAGQAATAAQAGTAKSAGMSSWRSSLSALPATPPASTSAQDVAQFEKNMTMAAASLTSTTSTADPSQAEANRALVQRMATYLAGLQTLSASNAQLRPPVNHAQQSFNSLGLLQFLVLANSLQTPNLQQPPPFALTAPESTDVSDADKDLSDELHARYETDAAHSAAIWQKAETLREGLAARGLSLNVHAATALVRLPLRFKSAANALRRNDWDAARTHLEEAEAETEKIADVAVK
jgi:hypothetical protein